MFATRARGVITQTDCEKVKFVYASCTNVNSKSVDFLNIKISQLQSKKCSRFPHEIFPNDFTYILVTMSVDFCFIKETLLLLFFKLILFVATSHAFNLRVCLSRSDTFTRDCDKFLSAFYKPLSKICSKNMCTCTINGRCCSVHVEWKSRDLK